MNGLRGGGTLLAVSFGIATVVFAGACGPGPSGAPGADVEVWVVNEPDVRIGSVDDPDFVFQFVGALAMSPSGILHSLHRGEAGIRRWTLDGQPLGSIGREGEGPGEFRSPRQMGFFGDSLWVVDGSNFRISYFDGVGEFLGSVTPTVDLSRDPDNPRASVVRPSHPLRDGTLHGIAPAWSDGIARGEITEVEHARLDPSGEFMGTIWTQPYRTRDILARLRPDGGGSFTRQPFGDQPLVVYPQNQALVVVERRVPGTSEAASVSVTRIGWAGDTLRSFEIPYIPVPLPAEVADSTVRAMAEGSFEFISRFDEGITLEGLVQDFSGAMYKPDYYPGFSEMLESADEHLWFKVGGPASDQSEWGVYSFDGELVARAHVPSELRILLVTGDAVWGVETDELDVNYIVRLGIDRG